MFNLNKSNVRLSLVAAVFLATASLCDAGERGRWTGSEDSGSAADMHQSPTENQEDGAKVSDKLTSVSNAFYMIPINITKTFLVSNIST